MTRLDDYNEEQRRAEELRKANDTVLILGWVSLFCFVAVLVLWSLGDWQWVGDRFN